MIEPGWTVVSADGTELGTVDQVEGDASEDIFNGLAVATGLLGRPRYVPAERVAEITQGQVRLDLSPDAVEKLEHDRHAPPSHKLEP
jgi:hypothetical protein